MMCQSNLWVKESLVPPVDISLITNQSHVQELVAVIPSQQNIKGICISVLVIKVVLALVTLSVFLMTPEDLGPRVHGIRMTLHNLTSDSLKPNKFNATWLSGEMNVIVIGFSCCIVFLLFLTKQMRFLPQVLVIHLQGNSIIFSLFLSFSASRSYTWLVASKNPEN